MILIGLMSGGDYQQGGIMRCGTTTAHGLAKCGFGDSLYTAATNLSRVQLAEFLVTWRHELCHELRTNSRGEIGRKQPALSNAIPEDFPDIDILFSYVRPITSESMGRESNNLKLTWAKEPDLGKLAGLCEFYFEWGYKESIIKRFRTVMWHSMTLRILRRAVLNLDARAEPSTSNLPTTPKKKGNTVIQAYGTPSKLIAQHFSFLSVATPSKRDVFDSNSENEADAEERLVLKIHGTRNHVSTDGMLEYRLEIAPKQLVKMAESGIKGTRVPEGPDEWASEEDEDEDAKTGKGKGN
jgi:Holliday junction resolvase YEN1